MHRSLALLWIVTAAPALADEVLLRGGGRVSGVIVEQTEARVVIEAAPGRVSLPAWRVERVVSGASALAVFEERASRLGATDADGWLDLGLWARSQGLQTRARAALARVLEIEPGNDAAHAALGHVPFGGRWVTREESYAARGLVEFEGSWITPEERAAAVRARTEAALAERALIEAEARVREAEARARAAEAETRRIEAEADAAYAGGGIPLGWAYAGGYGGWATPYPYDVRPSHRRGRGHDETMRPERRTTSPAPRPTRPASVGSGQASSGRGEQRRPGSASLR